LAEWALLQKHLLCCVFAKKKSVTFVLLILSFMGFNARSYLFLLLMVSFTIARAASDVADLPLREFPATSNQKILLVYFTGDGGWNSFSQQLVKQVNSRNYPVVAFDCRKYFWEAKTPKKFAEDVQRIISHYLLSWKLEKVAFVGYSFGADVAAFLPTQLQKSIVEKLLPIALMSPTYSTDFEIKLTDLMGGSTKVDRKYNVQEALLKSNVPVLCIFGKDEDLYMKEGLIANGKIVVREIPGSHRYDNNVELLTSLILENIAL